MINRSGAVAYGAAPKPSAWRAGLARTGIGVAAGITFGLLYALIASHIHYKSFHKLDPLFLAMLLPIRIGEWYLLLRWIYGKFDLGPSRTSALIAGGVVTSFVLDLVSGPSSYFLVERGSAERGRENPHFGQPDFP